MTCSWRYSEIEYRAYRDACQEAVCQRPCVKRPWLTIEDLASLERCRLGGPAASWKEGCPQSYKLMAISFSASIGSIGGHWGGVDRRKAVVKPTRTYRRCPPPDAPDPLMSVKPHLGARPNQALAFSGAGALLKLGALSVLGVLNVEEVANETAAANHLP